MAKRLRHVDVSRIPELLRLAGEGCWGNEHSG